MILFLKKKWKSDRKVILSNLKVYFTLRVQFITSIVMYLKSWPHFFKIIFKPKTTLTFILKIFYIIHQFLRHLCEMRGSLIGVWTWMRSWVLERTCSSPQKKFVQIPKIRSVICFLVISCSIILLEYVILIYPYCRCDIVDYFFSWHSSVTVSPVITRGQSQLIFKFIMNRF